MAEGIGDTISKFLREALEAGIEDIGKVTEELRTKLDGLDLEGFDSAEVNGRVVDGELVVDYGGSDLKTDPASLTQFTDSIRDGDVVKAYEDMGFPESYTTDPTFTDWADKQSAEIKEGEPYKSRERLKDSQARGEVARGGLPKDPTDAEAAGNDSVKKGQEDIAKKAEDAKKEGKTTMTVGDWVKVTGTVATFAAIGASVGLLIKAIRNHQNAMNGCWLVDDRGSTKNKVRTLTCSSSDRSKSCCDQYGNIGPNTGKNVTSTCKVHANCCDAVPAGSSGTIICQKYQIDKSGNIIKDANGVPLCSECPTQCKEANDCSSLCDCSQLANCPKGKHLQCVNVDFWGAAGDFLGEAFGGLIGGFLKGLWRVAKWIILAVGIVVLALVAWKIISFIISETKGKKSGFRLGWKRRPPRLKY